MSETSMWRRILPPGLRDSRYLLLSGFLFGISAFHRDFAHLAIVVAGVPLFPGELALGALVALEGVRLLRARRIPFRVGGASLLWALYLGLGLVFAIVGLRRGFGLAALRDSALVYYAVLLFLTQSIVRDKEHPARIFTPVAIGAAFGSTWTVASFLLGPRLSYEHGAAGFQALAAWLGLAYVAANPAGDSGRWRRWRWAAVPPLFAVIYLAGYRTMIGAAVLSLGAAATWVVLARGRARWAARRLLIAGVVACLLFVITVWVARFALGGPAPGSPTHGEVSLTQGLRVITDRWVRLFSGGEGEGPDEPSATFRLIAWTKAVARIRARPWTGIGFVRLQPCIRISIARIPPRRSQTAATRTTRILRWR